MSQVHPFAPNPEEARNRARQAGIALPGDTALAGPSQESQVMLHVGNAVANILSDRQILRIAAELYRDRKIEEPAGDMLAMMKDSCVETLALFDQLTDTIGEWVAARAEAEEALVEEAKTAEEAATEGGVDLSHLSAVEEPALD